MKSEKLTEKAREAIQQAAELAHENGQQAVEPEHLLLALVREQDGVARTLLERAGVFVQTLEPALDSAVARLAKVSGAGQPYLSPALDKMLEAAEREAGRLKGVFRALTESQITSIVDIQLRRLEERLTDRRIELDVTDAARQLLAQRGWDPVYGARPLKRLIQRLVQDPLAMMLLEGKFLEGDTVTAGARDGAITFSKAERPAPIAAAG